MPVVYDPVVHNGLWSVTFRYSAKSFRAVDAAEAKQKMLAHLARANRRAGYTVAEERVLLPQMRVTELEPTIRESNRASYTPITLRKTGRSNYAVMVGSLHMGDVFKEPGSSGWMGFYEFPVRGSVMGFGWTARDAAADLVNKIRKGEVRR